MNRVHFVVYRITLGFLLLMVVFTGAGNVMRQGEYDLAADSIELLGFEADGAVAVFAVAVTNLGEPAPETVVIVYHADNPDVVGESLAGEIEPGSTLIVTVFVEIPDELRGTTGLFITEVDPGDELPEFNERNNLSRVGGVEIPPLVEVVEPTERVEPEPTEDIPDEPVVISPEPIDEEPLVPLWLFVVIAGTVIAGIAVAAAVVLTVRANTRRKWQQQANNEEPPDSCTPPQRYCEAEAEVEFKRLKVAGVLLTSADPGSDRARRVRNVKGKTARLVDMAVRARLLAASRDDLVRRAGEASGNIAEILALFIAEETEVGDIYVSARLEGIEVTTTYTLYRCTGRPAPDTWKKLASWKAKRQDERDEVILKLPSVDPNVMLAQWPPPELAAAVLAYVERYTPI